MGVLSSVGSEGYARKEGYLVLTRWEHTGLFLLMLRNQKMNASNLGSIFKKNQ